MGDNYSVSIARRNPEGLISANPTEVLLAANSYTVQIHLANAAGIWGIKLCIAHNIKSTTEGT